MQIHFTHLIKSYGYLGVFGSLMLGMFGLPVPDETILTFTGFLVYKNYFHPAPAVLSAFLGSICGITVNYLVGRLIGFALLTRYGEYLRLSPKKLDQARQWFENYGKWALPVGYFLPGVRHLTAFAAGASRLQYPIFAPFAYTGGLLFVGTFIGLGYLVGEEWHRIMPRVQTYLWELVGLTAAFTAAAYLVWRLRRRRRRG
jgi:membrane protein DedA with SNARE-associated domain